MDALAQRIIAVQRAKSNGGSWEKVAAAELLTGAGGGVAAGGPLKLVAWRGGGGRGGGGCAGARGTVGPPSWSVWETGYASQAARWGRPCARGASVGLEWRSSAGLRR